LVVEVVDQVTASLFQLLVDQVAALLILTMVVPEPQDKVIEVAIQPLAVFQAVAAALVLKVMMYLGVRAVMVVTE
jgi:hypothetical protein